ncbi:conserved exported hypothetical protein [Vibrio coralliirubri]|nr:hypothetical protein [Vibrio coralliirubri]CDT20126.1 conserved exported hypothetical protein [Vibrio coralliirubri]CDT38705.1 conserved exported hypothetical protein [Vibrio coralliirubri]CDT78968.1 conserved exported hypothetical protein [Vibrio coralliirubri]CDT81912.1 conserved exported hypothetical protein [Vibrio coralliirubri]CDU13265.1 conserved exported hypothetical protein [Vibrio coralliirubri]
MNFLKIGKKSALTSLVIAVSSVMLASNVYATSTVTVTWLGTVPGSSSDGTMIVTGINGDVGDMSGDVNANKDGTFSSTVVRLEAHAVDPNDPTQAGTDLLAANWQVATATLAYGNQQMAGSDLQVMIDGTSMEVGDTVNQMESVTISVEQNEPLQEAMVAEQGVTAAVTLLVDPV